MSILLGIILTLTVFTLIVFLHELGHFLTARWTKMKVLEFGIGIPPKAKVLTKDQKGTEYTLNWLPIGGFVRIFGEDPGSSDAQKSGSFSSKKWWARALVLVAGVTMNFLLAFFIFFFVFLTGAKPLIPNTITESSYGSFLLPSVEESMRSGYLEHDGIRMTPMSGSIAESSGILPGDILLEVDGKSTPLDARDLLIVIQTNQSMSWKVAQSGSIREITITPESGKIGAYIGYSNLRLDREYKESFDMIRSLELSFTEVIALSRLTFDVLINTLSNLLFPTTPDERTKAVENVSGPIGLGAGFTDMVKMGIDPYILTILVALLSINLGVLNILPFPALDGGRLLSTTLRSIVGWWTPRRRLLDAVEYYFHAFGMVSLLLLSLLIAILDVTKLF